MPTVYRPKTQALDESLVDCQKDAIARIQRNLYCRQTLICSNLGSKPNSLAVDIPKRVSGGFNPWAFTVQQSLPLFSDSFLEHKSAVAHE